MPAKALRSAPLLLLAVAAVAACGPDPTGAPDAATPPGRDGGSVGLDADLLPSEDASVRDAGMEAPDAAVAPGPDADLPDASSEPGPDADLPDAGPEPGVDAAFDPPDADLPDAEAAPGLDAEIFDADLPDAEAAPAPDAETPDADLPDAEPAPGPDAGPPDAAPEPDGGPDGPDAGAPQPDGGWDVPVRVMAANLTSGNLQSYDPGHGLRLIQGVTPDVVLIQEFRYGDNEDATMQAMVDSTLGVGFSWCREYGTPLPNGTIPNGIISRWPILECGAWDDPETWGSREFAYARIDLPGPRDLWAVSLHLLTRDAPTRDDEAESLVTYLLTLVPEGDLLVVGGDFNTESLAEACYATLAPAVDVGEPHPADQDGNVYTNAKRAKPYDHVFADPDLRALQVPTYIGSSVYPAGLVLDSRVYTPLDEIFPVEIGDSAATNMQHMGVVKDFLVPY